ncbi:hypothetical protein COHA_005001 [Chlorella ohadii]|uniref:Transmembrane protein 19 n=1 Tax=Chlorella ohadii TaxID=2649997 RepID=A0AAD5H591_9CHLO|nr:hypothetical protein COHA_005001 [Chlorella ohadii]
MPLASLGASAALAAALALHGLRKRSLSRSGALAAMLVGFLHMAAGLRFGCTLILFYLSSSKLTRWRDDLKSRLDAAHSTGGQRGAAQVCANSLLGAALAVACAWQAGAVSSINGSGGSSSGAPNASAVQAASATLAAAFVAFYAVCCADTWSSEIGIASKTPPRLITTRSVVPPGTNGGVTPLGTAAAAAGGLFVGCCYWSLAAVAAMWAGANGSASSAALADWRLVPLALVAGLAGSLLDSLLGATLQWSGQDERSGKAVSGRPPPGSAAARHVRHVSGRDVLSNTGVNVVASVMSSGLAAAAWSAWAA